MWCKSNAALSTVPQTEQHDLQALMSFSPEMSFITALFISHANATGGGGVLEYHLHEHKGEDKYYSGRMDTGTSLFTKLIHSEAQGIPALQ